MTVLKSAPEHYYKMARKAFLGPMFENGPTVAHQKLVQLEQQGKLQEIITTNIDCLHTLAGSENVAEIQGNFSVNKCLKCGQHYDDVQIWSHGKCPHHAPAAKAARAWWGHFLSMRILGCWIARYERQGAGWHKRS